MQQCQHLNLEPLSGSLLIVTLMPGPNCVAKSVLDHNKRLSMNLYFILGHFPTLMFFLLSHFEAPFEAINCDDSRRGGGMLRQGGREEGVREVGREQACG